MYVCGLLFGEMLDLILKVELDRSGEGEEMDGV